MTSLQPNRVSSSHSQSQQVLARNGKSFYWASKFLGAELAERACPEVNGCDSTTEPTP